MVVMDMQLGCYHGYNVKQEETNKKIIFFQKFYYIIIIIQIS